MRNTAPDTLTLADEAPEGHYAKMEHLGALIRNIPDFPKPGIQFKDITTLLLDPPAFKEITDYWAGRYKEAGVDAIVGVDARGFIFGAALAYAIGLPFIAARKKGKLPGKCIWEEYALEYGTAILEIHDDALRAGQRVVLIDDLLATGGTTAAVAKLIRRLGAEVHEAAFVVELLGLHGRERLDMKVHTLVRFHVEE